MKMLPGIYSSARLSAIASTKSESHWVASLTTRKKRPTVMFSLLFAKSTTPNVGEIPKRVRSLNVTAFIAAPAKSSSGKQPQTHGTPIKARKLSSVRFRAYASRARRSERDHDFLQIVTAATAVYEATCLGSYLFLLALRFELRELLRSKDAFGILHELRLGCVRTPRFVVFGQRCFHLRLLIWRQVETRKRGRAGHLPFVASLLRAIAVFTREHCSR